MAKLELIGGTMPDSTIRDAAVEKATGHPSAHWFHLLDRWKGGEKGHTAMARWLHDEQGLSNWWAQMVTVLYERKRGLRKVHQRSGGFAVEVVRTVETTPTRAFLAMADPDHQARWFTTGAVVDLTVGGAWSNDSGDSGTFLSIQRPKRLRFTWENRRHAPGSVVEFLVARLPDGRVRISISHDKLSRERDAASLKLSWTRAIDSLKSYLETGRGVPDAEWKRSKTAAAKKKTTPRKKSTSRSPA